MKPTPEGLGIIGPYAEIVKGRGIPHVLWSTAMVRQPKTQKITTESVLVLQRGTFKTTTLILRLLFL